jgi:hypothetical protein
MLNFVENSLENERDPRSGPKNDQHHSLSLSDPDRSLVLSHFLTNFLQNLASCHTALRARFLMISKFCYCKNIVLSLNDKTLNIRTSTNMISFQVITYTNNYMIYLLLNLPPPGGMAILPEYIHYYGYYYQVIVQCLST